MGISIWQILVLCIFFFIPALLSVRILNKAGYPRWWALLFIVPILNAVMIWVFASAKWPASIGKNTQSCGENNQHSFESSNSAESGSKILCPKCGKDNDAPAQYCQDCGAVMDQNQSTTAESQTSGFAISSMVLGIIGLVIGWVILAIPSILAVVFGHLALGNIKNSKGMSGGSKMAIAGLVMGYVVVAIMIISIPMSMIAIPAYQEYTIRSRIYGVEKNIKNQVSVYVERTNNLPSNSSDLTIKFDLGLDKIVKSYDINLNGGIIVTFASPIEGQTMVFEPIKNQNKIEKWVCTGGTLQKKYRTSNCRQ